MNKYVKALNNLENEYDAFYFGNKYGDGTHPEEFKILSELKGEYVVNALMWIKHCYDCYYKDEYDDKSAFTYLRKIAEGMSEDE